MSPSIFYSISCSCSVAHDAFLLFLDCLLITCNRSSQSFDYFESRFLKFTYLLILDGTLVYVLFGSNYIILHSYEVSA